MRYKLVVTDLDGTLLDDRKNVSKANLEAIKKIRDAGVLFTVATGRGERGARPLLELLKPDVPAILFNGCEIFEMGKGPIYSEYLPKTIADMVVDHFLKTEFGIIGFLHDKIFLVGYKPAHEIYLKREKVAYEVVDDLRHLDAVNKVMVVGDVPRAMEMMGELEKKEGINLNCVKTEDFYYEVLPDGVSKGEGLKKLCEILGIERESVIAIGDNMNDLSMINFAGLGVAVENAEEPVKKAAKLVVPSNNDDGVAYLLNKLAEGEL